MKTTVKEYLVKTEERRDLNHSIRNFEDGRLWSELEAMETKVEELKINYFDKLERVNCSFLIGSRSYFEVCVKIGKTLFNNGRKMTKSNGFWCVKIIEEITKEMKQSMISDSHYY